MKITIKPIANYLRRCRDQGKLSLLWGCYYFLVSLFSKCENFLLLFAIELKLPIHKAYRKTAKNLLIEAYKIVESGVRVEYRSNDVYRRLKKYLKIVNELEICDTDFDQIIAEAFLVIGKSDDWKATCIRLIENQEKMADSCNIKNIRILEPGEIYRNLGTTLVLDAWIKSGLLGLRSNCRSLVLNDRSQDLKPVNQCLLDYWKPYIEFIESPDQIESYKKFLKPLCAKINYYLPTGDTIIPYTHSAVVFIQKMWEEKRRGPLIHLNDEHKERGMLALRNMGVKDGSWIVITHVREPGYKGGECFRDSDVYTYLKAYKEIISRGGTVIRMGDATMKPLPKLDGLIDYALSKEKSDWLDIFLLSNARFMIGTSSGPATVSYIFNVPVVMTNNLPSAATYLSKKDIFMPRLLRRFDGSFVSIKETMTLPYSMGTMDSIYKNVFKVEVIPNTEDEITEAVLEMMDRLNGYEIYSESDEILQSKFKKIMADNEMMIGIRGFSPQARLAKFFLKKHCELLD